jgi:hypothetical protein
MLALGTIRDRLTRGGYCRDHDSVWYVASHVVTVNGVRVTHPDQIVYDGDAVAIS